EIAHAPEVALFGWRVGDQFTDYPAIGKHPVAAPRDELANENTARNPAGRFTVARRRKKNISRSNHHNAATGRFHRDRAGIARQLDGTNIALAGERWTMSKCLERWY